MSDGLMEFPYQELEREADKRRQRIELESLMTQFLSKGGEIRRVGVLTSPRPKFKNLNRKARKKNEE